MEIFLPTSSSSFSIFNKNSDDFEKNSTIFEQILSGSTAMQVLSSDGLRIFDIEDLSIYIAAVVSLQIATS